VRERELVLSKDFYIILSLSLAATLRAASTVASAMGCSRFNCYEICKSRKRSRRCHVKAYVRVTAIIGKQGAPHSEAAGCALSLWGIRRFAPGLMEIQPEQSQCENSN